MTTNTGQPVVNSMHTTVYSADGYKLNIVLAIEAIEDISGYLDQIRAAGLTPNIPGLEPGQEKETIAAVVRRASKKGTPIIDFYPHWQNEGRFGLHKWAHMYLDTPEQIAEFETLSGLRLKDLPLYEGQQAIQREMGKPTRFEMDVKHSFEIVRTPDGTHDTGMAKYIYSYAAPAPLAAQPQTPPKQAAATPKTNEGAKPRATTSETAQTGFDEPFFADWWTDGAQVTYVKDAIGTPPGLALGKMGRNFNEFETPDAMIAAYRAYTEGVMNHDATPTAQATYELNDPLKGEMLNITSVEPHGSKRMQWVGVAMFEKQPVRILLYKEDEIAIRGLGYDTSKWDKPTGQQYKGDGITVITMLIEGGRKVASVWDSKTSGWVNTERAS